MLTLCPMLKLSAPHQARLKMCLGLRVERWMATLATCEHPMLLHQVPHIIQACQMNETPPALLAWAPLTPLSHP